MFSIKCFEEQSHFSFVKSISDLKLQVIGKKFKRGIKYKINIKTSKLVMKEFALKTQIYRITHLLNKKHNFVSLEPR